MCVCVGTGDSGGAVFKNYESRTIQVNSHSHPTVHYNRVFPVSISNDSFRRSHWSAGETRICAKQVQVSSSQMTPPEISILIFSKLSLFWNLSLETTTRMSTHHFSFWRAKFIYILYFALVFQLYDWYIQCFKTSANYLQIDKQWMMSWRWKKLEKKSFHTKCCH